jgi:hypothetical protein
MNRWAVLWDVSHGADRRVGLAIEQDGYVRVVAPPSYCVPSRFDGEYRVLQPDGSLMIYGPGREGYFDQVLVELSRVFAVGKQDATQVRDKDDLIRLFATEVFQPTQRNLSGRYISPQPTDRDHQHEGSPVNYSPRLRNKPERVVPRRHGYLTAA